MQKCPICGMECIDYSQHVKEEHSISCEEVKDKALAYAKGETSEEDTVRIDYHFCACKSCLRAAERIWKRDQKKKNQEVIDGQSSVKTETDHSKVLL